jgi:hypothetical protein
MLSLHAHLAHNYTPPRPSNPAAVAQPLAPRVAQALLSRALGLSPYCWPAWQLLARTVHSRAQLYQIPLPAHWMTRLGLAEALLALPGAPDEPEEAAAAIAPLLRDVPLAAFSADALLDRHVAASSGDAHAGPAAAARTRSELLQLLFQLRAPSDLLSLMASLAVDMGHSTAFLDLLLRASHLALAVSQTRVVDDAAASAQQRLAHTLTRALRSRDPLQRASLPTLASLLLHLGDSESLASLAQTALRSHPHTYECCYVVAMMQLALQNWVQAQQWLQRCVRLSTASATYSVHTSSASWAGVREAQANAPQQHTSSTSCAPSHASLCPAPALLIAQCRLALGDATGAAQWAMGGALGNFPGGAQQACRQPENAVGNIPGGGSGTLEMLGRVMEGKKLFTHALHWYKRAAASGGKRPREDVERVEALLGKKKSRR